MLRQMNLNAWNGKRKIHFEDFPLIWENNIRMDIKEMVMYWVEWIHPDQEKSKRRAFVIAVMHKMGGVS